MQSKIKIFGDQQAGEEIQQFLARWDEVICQLNIQNIAELCAEHISLDTSKSADPIAENVAAYDKAYAEYSKMVETLTDRKSVV